MPCTHRRHGLPRSAGQSASVAQGKCSGPGGRQRNTSRPPLTRRTRRRFTGTVTCSAHPAMLPQGVGTAKTHTPSPWASSQNGAVLGWSQLLRHRARTRAVGLPSAHVTWNRQGDRTAWVARASAGATVNQPAMRATADVVRLTTRCYRCHRVAVHRQPPASRRRQHDQRRPRSTQHDEGDERRLREVGHRLLLLRSPHATLSAACSHCSQPIPSPSSSRP